MARIRSVHPGLWTDEAFVSVSPLARLLAIGIWGECDDQGAFEWKPVTLKMRLLPMDHVDVPALLAELEAANSVRKYEVDGRHYGAVRNFAKFQRPKKPNSIHPMPDEFRTYAGHSEPSSEPDDDETPSGSPPVPHSPPTEACSVPPKSEKSPQMEDGGDKREEPPLRPPLALTSDAPAKPSPTRRSSEPRGSRLPPDWQPNPNDVAFARQCYLDPKLAADEFRDFWCAVPGARGRKIDWSATFRNRCRERAGRPSAVIPLRKPGISYAGNL